MIWSSNTGKVSRWNIGGMSKAFIDPFCFVPVRLRETRLDECGGIRLLSAHSTPKKRWCKRCNTPMGNLIQTLLPAVILGLLGKIAKQLLTYYCPILSLIRKNTTKTHRSYIRKTFLEIKFLENNCLDMR